MIERIINGPLHTNTYIVATGKKECIIIDPSSDAEALWQATEKLNLAPHAIIFTHGHIDHTSGAMEIIEHYKEKDIAIKVGIHEADAAYLGVDGHDINKSLFPENHPDTESVFHQLYKERPDCDFFLKHGEIVPDTDLEVIHTPGHTAGSVCFYSEEREVLFTGDTLFFDAVARTNIPGGDHETLEKSITELLFVLPPSTRVFPGHGPETNLERETRNNQFKTDHGMI